MVEHGRIERESTQNLARVGVDNANVFVDDEHHDSGPRVRSTDPNFVEPGVVPQRDFPGLIDPVVAYPVLDLGAISNCCSGWFRVDGGGRGSSETAVRSTMVVFVDELIEEGLEFFDRCWRGPGLQPVFHGLLEPFDFPAGGRMAWFGVFLVNAEFEEKPLEPVEAGYASASEPCGVIHAVI